MKSNPSCVLTEEEDIIDVVIWILNMQNVDCLYHRYNPSSRWENSFKVEYPHHFEMVYLRIPNGIGSNVSIQNYAYILKWA